MTTDISSGTLAAALAYLQRGWSLVPLHGVVEGNRCTCGNAVCDNAGKHPIGRWQQYQTRRASEAEVRKWIERWRRMNIGVITGQISNLIVLDVDGTEGAASIAGKQLPPTAVAQTGGGGQHYLFTHPGDPLRNFARKLPGLDLRGDGGLIVAPPSLHVSGNRYSWLVSPDDADLAELPQWILELCAKGKTEPQRHRGTEAEGVIKDGYRNTTLFQNASAMRRRGFDRESILAALRIDNQKRCEPPLEDKDLQTIAESASQYRPEPPPMVDINDPANWKPLEEGERIRIRAECQDLPVITNQCWQALLAANAEPKYFRHAGVLARLELDGDELLVPVELTPDRLRHELARIADWYKEKQDGKKTIEVPAKPPPDVMRDVLATPNPPLPVLTRITEVPVFAPDGSLSAAAGYHAEGQTYLTPVRGLAVPSISAQPDADEIARARDLLIDLVHDFPFVSDADRAHALALPLLPFVRDLISGPTPLHLIEAPTPGTGKGLMVDALMQAAVGTRIGIITEARDDEEWRKRITAQLKKAQSVVKLDNLTHSIDSGALAAVLTATVWEDRVLGKSEIVDIPVRCTWIATANNPTMSTEIARRCIRIRLDPRRDRPWLRNGFRHPSLGEYAIESRTSLIWACLTLAQAWLSMGRPRPDVRPLGSYEAWTWCIGGILSVAGIPGFLSNLDEFYEMADSEGTTLRQFVGGWWGKYAENPVGTAELFPIALEVDGIRLGKGNDRSQKTALGMLLKRHRDRVIGEHRIVRTGTNRSGGTQWSLQPTQNLIDSDLHNLHNLAEPFPSSPHAREASEQNIHNRVERSENVMQGYGGYADSVFDEPETWLENE